MIQHAHGKDRIEGLQFWGQLLNAHRQHPHLVPLQVLLQGPVLHHEQRGRVDADHLRSPGAQHPPAVVAAAAAHVEHPAAGQAVDGIGQAIPLPVGAPLGVDMYAKQLEGTLAPGVQSLQLAAQQVCCVGVRCLVAVGSHPCLIEPDTARRHIGELLQYLQPAGKVAVTLRGQSPGNLAGQQLRPGVHVSAPPAVDKGLVVDHLSAISEAKLKHWNHTSQLLKPASAMRLRWCARVSGSSTFSMALRLRAISRSL